MELISREELEEKLDRGDDFKLVMTLGEWAFHMAHIPSSLNINSLEHAREFLAPEDESVVYCSDVNCIATRRPIAIW
jgi:hypothetical protein